MVTAVVFGVTGYSGSAIANELLDRGNHVIGVARNADAAAKRENLEVVSGSIHDASFVKNLFGQADVAVIALPAHATDGHTLAEAIPEVLSAAYASGTRIGVVGGAGSLLVSEDGPALVDAPGFPDVLKPEVAAHREVLAALDSPTGVDWFYVSPAGGYGPKSPGERTGRYRTGGTVLLTDAEGKSRLSAADLGVAIADEIEKPAHHRERFTVAY